jgi:hypothetical protein
MILVTTSAQVTHVTSEAIPQIVTSLALVQALSVTVTFAHIKFNASLVVNGVHSSSIVCQELAGGALVHIVPLLTATFQAVPGANNSSNVLSPVLVQLVFDNTTSCASVTYLLSNVSNISDVANITTPVLEFTLKTVSVGVNKAVQSAIVPATHQFCI